MNPWEKLRSLTNARVGLGRVGSSLPTKHVLAFQRAHAAARSAVWLTWETEPLQKHLEINFNENPQALKSQATDRDLFLRFPNKGRSLSLESQTILSNQSVDIAFIVSDGLSALAIQNHFLPLWNEFAPAFRQTFPELKYQIFLVPFGRVAIGDDIGGILGARLSVIFIGERPGLNSPDSLGLYLTFHPKPGRTDAERNCISNIRGTLGLDYGLATVKLLYLMKESLRLQLSGVDLKEDLLPDPVGFHLETTKKSP